MTTAVSRVAVKNRDMDRSEREEREKGGGGDREERGSSGLG